MFLKKIVVTFRWKNRNSRLNEEKYILNEKRVLLNAYAHIMYGGKYDRNNPIEMRFKFITWYSFWMDYIYFVWIAWYFNEKSTSSSLYKYSFQCQINFVIDEITKKITNLVITTWNFSRQKIAFSKFHSHNNQF